MHFYIFHIYIIYVHIFYNFCKFYNQISNFKKISEVENSKNQLFLIQICKYCKNSVLAELCSVSLEEDS